MNLGTDTLSYGIKTKVNEWMSVFSPGFVLAEGDRLANRPFFEAASQLGYRVLIVLIDAPVEVARSRYRIA